MQVGRASNDGRADEKTLQHDLDLARADVHRGQAYLARGRLKSIQSDIDDLKETSLWAEHELVYAGALAGMLDPGAQAAYEELALSSDKTVRTDELWRRGPFSDPVWLDLLHVGSNRVLGLINFVD